mgnify:CR=1 FL=1
MKFLILSALIAAALPLNSAFSADVIDGWARATLAKQSKNGAAYMIITNSTDKDEKLLGASSDVAEMVEVHNMTFEDGIMRMQEVDELEIPAGETVKLEPGGYHIMLLGLKEPLRVGQQFDVVLNFEKSGEEVVPVEVHPRKGRAGGGMNHNHGHSH